MTSRFLAPAPIAVALALSYLQPGLAQWLSCVSPDDVQIPMPQLLEDLEQWTQNEEFIVDGDVELVDAASNVFSIRNKGSTDAFLVTAPPEVSIDSFYGSPVHIRGDLHSSGSSIMLSVSQSESDFDQATVLVCEVSGTDAVHARRLNAVYKCFINGNPVDELGHEISKRYRGVGHRNDGNEGNEGNEGKEVKTCRWIDDDAQPAGKPAAASTGGQCDKILDNKDVPGANLPGSGKTVASMQACIDLCKATANCNAVVRAPRGNCFMKSVAQNVAVKTRNRFTAHISCGSNKSLTTPPPPPINQPPPMNQGTAKCGEVLTNTDVPGKNLRGSGANAANMQGCVALCAKTATCNAVVRTPNGKCYMKSVARDAVAKDSVASIVKKKNGLTSHVACTSASAGPTTAAPPTPKTGGTQCGKFVANKDVPGANLPGSGKTVDSKEACAKLCAQTPTCNAVVWNHRGKCFMKNVAADTGLDTRQGLISYISCGGVGFGPVDEDTNRNNGNEGALKPVGVNKKLGKYGKVMPFPHIPVAAAVLPNGKILSWAAYSEVNYDRGDRYVKRGGGSGKTKSSIFDPKTGKVSAMTVSNTHHDMFCPGIAFLPEGDIVVTGGQNADRVSVFDVSSNTWKTAPTMDISRGYGSTIALSTGKIFTLGGSWSGPLDVAKDAEIYTRGSTPWNGKWQKLKNVQAKHILTRDVEGVYRADNYGWFFAWKGGSVFHAGPSTGMHWFTTNNQGAVKDAGTRPGRDSANGNAVMFDAGKILTFGGSRAFAKARFPATTDCALIEINNVNQQPKVKKMPGMKLPRVFVSSAVLPDGKIFATGGASRPREFYDGDAHYQPEIWDQETGQWTLLNAKHKKPRTYHSIALLMPDGRVLTGGGGLCGRCSVNHPDVEIFEPQYLFTPGGEYAVRPTVKLDRNTALNGSMVKVTSSDDIMMVSLIRLGSVTHSTNTDQRRVELCGPYSKPCSGNTVTVQIPSDDGVAVPGYWMVFVVNKHGIASEAAMLQIKP